MKKPRATGDRVWAKLHQPMAQVNAERKETHRERYERRFNEKQQARFVARGRRFSARMSALLQGLHGLRDSQERAADRVPKGETPAGQDQRSIDGEADPAK